MKGLIFKLFLSGGVALALLFSIPSHAAGLDDNTDRGELKRRGDGTIDDSQPGRGGRHRNNDIGSDGLKRRGDGSIDDNSRGDHHRGGDDHGRVRNDDRDHHSGRGRDRGRGRGRGRDDHHRDDRRDHHGRDDDHRSHRRGRGDHGDDRDDDRGRHHGGRDQHS